MSVQIDQKALFIQFKSGPFVLRKRSISPPEAGQLLVKNESVALNPIDWKVQRLGLLFQESQYPIIVGTDVAGVVVQVGEEVSEYQIGDRVFFQGAMTHTKAGYQEYTITDAATTAKIPPSITFDQASSIPVALAAAVVGLYAPTPHGAGLKDPFDAEGRGAYTCKPVLIIGGATSVGQAAIQLARLSGFFPILTVASVSHTEYLQSIGATTVLDRYMSSSDLFSAVKYASGSKPIEVVYDSVSSGETQRFAYQITAPSGMLLVVNQPNIEDKEMVEHKKIVKVIGFFTSPHTRPLGERLYAKLEELVRDGDIKSSRVEVIPGGLTGVENGLQKLQNNQVSRTKLVVHPQETPEAVDLH